MLNVIKGEIRKMDKIIYPNAAVRLMVKIAGKVRESIQSYRQNRSLKEEMLSIRLKQKRVDYNKKENGKDTDVKNELRESSKQTLNAYKKKGTKLKSRGENEPALKKESIVLPKKRRSENHGRTIY